jgi:3-hydroxyisobutyrate dehydrogenase-like beta-hydroxyacid dehydrogenase
VVNNELILFLFENKIIHVINSIKPHTIRQSCNDGFLGCGCKEADNSMVYKRELEPNMASSEMRKDTKRKNVF